MPPSKPLSATFFCFSPSANCLPATFFCFSASANYSPAIFFVLVRRRTVRQQPFLDLVRRRTIRRQPFLVLVCRQTIRRDYKLILCSGKLFAGNLVRYQIPIRVDESMRLWWCTPTWTATTMTTIFCLAKTGKEKGRAGLKSHKC